MLKVDVRHNIDQVLREVGTVQRNIRDRAIGAALNKTIAKCKTEATRAITDEYMLQAGQVRPALDITKASARLGNFVAIITPFGSRSRRGRSLNLIHFVERKVTLAEARRRAKRGTLKQIGFRIKRKGGTKQLPGIFIANKGRTVFRRRGKARLPIEPVQTIDVPGMFSARRINARVVTVAEREFPIEFARALKAFVR